MPLWEALSDVRESYPPYGGREEPAMAFESYSDYFVKKALALLQVIEEELESDGGQDRDIRPSLRALRAELEAALGMLPF